MNKGLREKETQIWLLNQEFTFHLLNEKGKGHAQDIAIMFNGLLENLKLILPEGRELSLVRTKLEEACFFAKKSMANQLENQQ